MQGRGKAAKYYGLLSSCHGGIKSKILGLTMSIYSGLFYIHEEKRFARWEEYIEFYRQQRLREDD